MVSKFRIPKKTLGGALITGLVIQHIFPAIKLGSISWIATVLYLLVAIYLLLF